MKSSEYWQKRFSLLEDSRHNAGAEIYKTIERQYQRAKKEIESEISRWYRRIADNNGVSMAEARKLLKADELKEFHWDVDEYIKYGEEHEISGEWAKELENASAKFHISRLEALEINTRQSVEALYGKQQTLVSDFLGETYKSDYYHTAFELQKGFEIGFDIGTVNDDYLQKVLYKPWAPDGSNFSDRIWTNKDKLLNEIHTELTQSILTGADPQKAIDAISHDLDVSKANAGRLVMTESAYFGTLAQQDCFNDLGVEEYEIVATLDDRTSAICQSMDGQHFPMKDFEAGVSAPPFHVNCRSCTCPYFDDEFSLGGERAARDENGEVYYVPADTKYPEWKEAFVDGGSKEGLTDPTKEPEGWLPWNKKVDKSTKHDIIKEKDKSSTADRSKAIPASNPEVQEILDKFDVIENEHTWEEDLEATNPNFEVSLRRGELEYLGNCQRCVSAYEARRRGYDVRANARLIKNDDFAFMNNDNGWANVYENGKNELIPCFGVDKKEVVDKVTTQMESWGTGARAIVRVQWVGGRGHTFISENHDGNIIYVDPQTGSTDVKHYFQYIKTNKTYLLRTDDKEFTELIKVCCHNRIRKR